MGRIAILDGLRGYFLVFTIVNHLKLIGGVWLSHVNLGELGFVQDVQGFVFLSGLLVGLVHSRRMLAQGFAPAARKMWRRALEIYCYALACLFGIAALSSLIPGAAAVWSGWLWGLGYHDPGYLASAAMCSISRTTWIFCRNIFSTCWRRRFWSGCASTAASAS